VKGALVVAVLMLLVVVVGLALTATRCDGYCARVEGSLKMSFERCGPGIASRRLGETVECEPKGERVYCTWGGGAASSAGVVFYQPPAEPGVSSSGCGPAF